jgi:fibronectin-binding autotransporter adhesin
VTVQSGGTLGGTGTIGGSAIWQSGAKALPNAASPLTVAGTAILTNTTFTTTAALTSSGSPYTLLTAGSITGTSTVNSAPGAGSVASGYIGVVSIVGNTVKLTVTSSGVSGVWTDGNHVTDDNWSDAANWTVAGVPHVAGDSAFFGTGAGLPSAVVLNVAETVGGVTFSNSGSYTISGGNTLTLDNTAHGAALTVNDGTANAIQTAVSLNDSVTATVAGGKSLAVSGIISGTSTNKTLAVNGAGTLALSGNNSYGPLSGTVGTTLSGGGTLQVGHNNALGAGDLSVSGSSTLQAGAALSGVNNNVIIGSGVTATVDNSSANSLTLGGVISGSGGSLTKTSNGTLTLGNANNSYTGSTTINGGFVSVSAEGTAGTPGNLGTVPASFTFNNINLNGGGLLGNTTVALNANRGITLTGTGLLDAASGQTFTVNGVIASSGSGITVNSGAGDTGTVVLTAANTFSGTTTVPAGTLQLENALALQNSTLDMNGGALDFGALTAATIGGLSGSQNITLANDTPAAVVLTIGTPDGTGSGTTATYSGVLGGGSGASLQKLGGVGTITIGSGANGGLGTNGIPYTGIIVVDGGTLVLGGVGNAQLTTPIHMSGNHLQGVCSLVVADSASIATTGLIGLNADDNYANNHSPNAATLTVKNNASLSGSSLNFGGDPTGGGNNLSPGDFVTVQDNGSLTVSGSFNLNEGINNSTTTVNLNGGTLTVGNFLESHTSSVLNFNGGALAAYTNDAATSTTFLPALAGLTVRVTNTVPAVFVNTNGFTNTIAAVLANTTTNTDGGLVKRGGGALILDAVNTYKGSTVVSNGTLVVNGSITTNSVLILTNGTLGGSGTVNGVVTNQGTLAPGAITNVAGTVLTLNNNLTLLPGSTTIMQVSHNGFNGLLISDNVNCGGNTIAYGGTLTIVTNAGDAVTYQVGDYCALFAGTISGSFTAIQPNPGPGLVWSNDMANPGNFIVASGSVAPPPPAAGFMALTSTNIFVMQSVTFTNTSTGDITNSTWSFGDGREGFLTGANVTNNVSDIYTNAGSYTVQLIVSGSGGAATNTQSAYIVVKPVPVLGRPAVVGGNFVFNGTNGVAGAQYRIVSSTNVAQSLATWPPLVTNTFNSDGSYTFTNTGATNKARFFRLVSP